MTFRDDYWTHNPIKVRGGLRLEEHSLNQWWAERWLEALDGFSIGHRQVRGKRYALQGQVIEISVVQGSIRALVQGTRREPYRIEMGVKTLTEAEWQRVFEQLRSELSDVSKLLAGYMPHGLEHVFYNAGVSLFPRTEKDLWTKCSCPDESNPCKHIAAVHYILAQEFGRDPFLVLKLRGLCREELFHNLGLGPSSSEDVRQQDTGDALHVATFWIGGGGELPPLPMPEGPSNAQLALIKQLGPFPLWRGQRSLFNELKGIYSQAQATAVDLLASAESSEDSSTPDT